MPPIAQNGDASDGIPVTTIAMKLMDCRLQGATAWVTTVAGSFTAAGRAEVCALAADGVLKLWEMVAPKGNDDEDEDDTMRLRFCGRAATHSILRSAVAVRHTGETTDLLAVGSDSGALSLVQWRRASDDAAEATLHIIHVVDFGKTAVRRGVPGQYVAADPAGRALCVAAVEKTKLVYVLNRNAAGETTLASPLEAHRNATLTVDMVGLDNGYDNPLFGVLELAYPANDDDDDDDDDKDKSAAKEKAVIAKEVAYYELDLGLNHVIRRWATPVPSTACKLVALPGGASGPGGLLVAASNGLCYVHETNEHVIPCVLPRRANHGSAPLLLTQLTVHKQKKSKFFVLGQTELGDVYKITVQVQDQKVTGLTAALLDTLPVANALHVNKLGLLFVCAEFGAHAMYQFERIDLPDAPTNMSPALDDEACQNPQWLETPEALASAVTFDASPRLINLRKLVSLDNPSPTTGVLVGELAGNETSPQVYTLTGRGPTSALRILRHGAAVTELAVSDLPGVPGGIFTVQSAEDPSVDQYIVVSFADASLVLSVGETVEEVGKESGFLTNSPTLACTALGKEGALCQVHPAGVRHIKDGQAKQWNCPGLKRIEYASANEAQVLIALAGGEVIYFELDPLNGNLTEAANRDLKADVCCLDVGRLPGTSSRSMWAAVGFRDHTVRIVSLQPGGLLVQKSSTATQSRPHSVALLHGKSANDPWTLVIGLDDGSSLRTTVDPVTGAIGTSVTRRFLGVRPVSVSRMRLDGQSAMMLLSSRSWVGTTQKYAPLSYLPLDNATSFSSAAVPEGLVATAGKTLRILSIDTTALGSRGDDEAFHAQHVGLRYTPRQMALLAAEHQAVVLAVVESDYNDYGYADKKAKGFDPDTGKTTKATDNDDAMDVDSDEEDKAKEDKEDEDEEEDEEEKEARRTVVRGPVPTNPGTWGSCVRIMNPADNCKTLDCIEFGRNEAALCCCSVRFHSKGGEPLLAVGTVSGMTLNPLKQSGSHVLLYRVVGGERLQLLHRTTVEDGPILAMAHFQGRLLVGIGKSLRLYEMGKRQLLRKCELKGLPTFCKTLQTAGDRAFVGDMMTSIQIVRYDATANRLALIASDPTPRPIVCQELLDWNTVAVGDKFGNVSILRLPTGADTTAVDYTGQRALWDSTRADITPRMELLCQYYVGEVVTSMTRSALVAGGPESIIYVTVTGRIGALVPFGSRDDVDFYTQLEGALRTEAPRPTGRDPQSYRSYYAPVLHVIDGDLCSSFRTLSFETQTKVGEAVDRTIGELNKKLEDTRNALL